MDEMVLGEYAMVEARVWTVSALLVATAVVRLWDTLRLGLSPRLALVFTLLALLGLLAARGLRCRTTLDPGVRRLVRTTRCFGRVLRTRTIDVSDAAWVRVRALESNNQWVVEAGTAGYKTCELQRLSRGMDAGLAQAQALSARVAQVLGIADQGWRPPAFSPTRRRG